MPLIRKNLINCFVFLFVIQILLPSYVNCGKEGISSKIEILKLLMDIHNLPSKLIQKVREKPILQLMGLANDIVEPIVTAAEVILLLDELKKKLNKEHEKHPPPIHLPTKDHFMVFSGKNKLEVNHHKKGMKGYHKGLPYNQIEESLYSKPNLKIPDSGYDSMIPLDTTHAMSVSHEPLLLSSEARRSPNANYFKMAFLSDYPPMDWHLVRDLPNNFAMTYRNPIRKGKKSKKNSKKRKTNELYLN